MKSFPDATTSMEKAGSASEAPSPRNTLPMGTVDPRDAAEDVPESTQHARALIVELEQALDGRGTNPSSVARIERAWAAWNMSGASDATIQRVAHLVDRAYHAIHDTPGRRPSRKSSGLAISSCAQVLYNGLPASVRERLDFADVMSVVHSLEREVELWPAVVRATAELLGWNRVALAHAGHAIKQALATKIEPLR